jgi:hypothetical protein
MAVSLTNRTVHRLKDEGWPLVQVVEHYNAFTKRKHDLFGIIDVMAVGDKGILMVQVTSRGNMSSRIRKIADSEAIDHLRDADIQIIVEGWDKHKGRWRSKITDIS